MRHRQPSQLDDISRPELRLQFREPSLPSAHAAMWNFRRGMAAVLVDRSKWTEAHDADGQAGESDDDGPERGVPPSIRYGVGKR